MTPANVEAQMLQLTARGERLTESLARATLLAPIAGHAPSATQPGLIGRLASRAQYGLAQLFTARQKRFNLEIAEAARDLAATMRDLADSNRDLAATDAALSQSLADMGAVLETLRESLREQVAATRDPSFFAEGIAMLTASADATLERHAARHEEQMHGLRTEVKALATQSQLEHVRTDLAFVAAAVNSGNAVVGQLRELAGDKPKPRAWLETTRDGFEAACRRGVRYYPLTSEIGVADVLGSAPIFVRTADANAATLARVGGIDTVFTPHLIRDGYWESWFTVAMIRHVKPGMRVADVGANCGYYTLLLGHLVGAGGKVLACEPNPALAPLVEMSARFNGLNWVEVFQGAVGDKVGTVDLAVGAGMLNATILDVGQDMPKTTVPMRTLDDLCGDERLDFVKIDVEGAEEFVWRGMSKLRARNPKIAIFMEFNADRLRSDAKAMLDAIRAEGFQLRTVDYAGSLIPISESDLLHTHEEYMLWLARD